MKKHIPPPPKWKREFLSEREVTKLYGRRCEEQQAGCPVCSAWTRFDLINHMRWEDANTRVQHAYDVWKEKYGG